MLTKSMPLSHILLAIVVVVVWGLNWVVIKIGLDGIPPLLLASARFFLTSLPAIFFIKRPTAPFKMVAWYGLVMFALQFGLLFIGMYAGVTPGLASVLVQLSVFVTILFGVLFFGEKVHIWQVIGALVAFSGIGLIAMHFGGSLTLTGFLLVIGAAVAWSMGNLLSKKLGKVNMVALVVWGSLVAWPPLLLASFIMEGPAQIVYSLQHLTLLSGGAVFYITYLSTLLGFGLWSWLLHHHPLGSAAPFTLLIPVLAILSSALVLGEPLQLWKISAAALVIVGLCINIIGPRFQIKKAK